MPWARLDDKFHHHPKVLKAGPLASWLFICGLCYCSEYLTDGFIEQSALSVLAALPNPQDLAATLVEVGLWEPVDGGYRVHDYLVYNPSAAKVKEEREAARERMRQARGIGGEQDGDECDCSPELQANNERTCGEVPAKFGGPVPVPVPVPVPDSASAPDGADARAPDPPAPRARRTRTPEERRKIAIVRALREHFVARTGLSPPAVTSVRSRKGVMALWWNPLREIAARAGWDLRRAQALITDAVIAMRNAKPEPLTIKAPSSILAVATDLAARGRHDRRRYVDGPYGDRVQK